MDKKFSKSFRLQTTLMSRILLGEYQKGDLLPPVGELMSEFAVSAATVKRVFDELSASKLVRRRQGRRPVVWMQNDCSSGVAHDLKVVMVRDKFTDGLYFGYRGAPWTWTLQDLIYNRMLRAHIPLVTIGKNDLGNMYNMLGRVSGVIYVSAQVDLDVVAQLESFQVPYSIITGFSGHMMDNMVCYDYAPATERMGVYLLSCGVKKVDIISYRGADRRLENMINMLLKNNFKAENIRTLDLDSINCDEELTQHYREPQPAEHLPLGVVCYHDSYAASIEKQFRLLDYQNKKDYVILSMGNLLEKMESCYCTMEMEQLVNKGIDMLFRRMKKFQAEPVCMVEPEFVINRRKSGGKV